MKHNKVSVLVPTRHRIHRLETLLQSYDATIMSDGSSELVFRVDDDDHETIDYLTRRLAGRFRVLVGPRLGGYNSLAHFFNEAYAASTGDVLMTGNDDIIFQTVGWAPLLLEAADRYPDGLFNLGVHTLNELHYPFGITSRRVADHLGFYWDPSIFWGDIYLRDIMAAFDRCILLPHVEIVHDWAGFAPDQVFNESDKDIVGRDPTYWSVTHRRAVDSAVEKLRVLYDQHLCASA